MHFRPVLASLRPEAGAPVSIAQVAGIPQPSTPPELLEGFTVSLAIATQDIVVESSKQWSEEELFGGHFGLVLGLNEKFKST